MISINTKAEIAPKNDFGGSNFAYLLGKTPILLLGAITALSAVLCFHNIGARQFWYDEGVSLGMAELPWHDVIQAAPTQPNMWLYYFLLRGWLHFGDSEGWIRSLSAIFIIATVPILYSLVKETFESTKAGVVAALLFAVNAGLVKYAQEARSYGMEVFLATALCYVFVRWITEKHRTSWTWYALLASLLIYIQFFSVFVLFANACAVAYFRSKKLWREFACAICSVTILTLPLWHYVFILPDSASKWIQPTSVAGIYDLANRMTGNGGVPLIALYLLLCSAGAYQAFRRKTESNGSYESRAGMMVVFWLLAPTGAMLLISIVRPMLVSRYLLMVVPAGIALGAAGLAGIKRSSAFAVVLTVWLSLSVYGTWRYYRNDLSVKTEVARNAGGPEREDYRQLATFLVQNGREGDALAFYFPQMRILYEYYLGQIGNRGADPKVLYPGPTMSFRDITGQLSSSLSKRDQFQRIWFVEHRQGIANADEMLPFLRHAFRCAHPYESQFDYPTWRILLYSKTPGDGGTPYQDNSAWANRPCHPPA